MPWAAPLVHRLMQENVVLLSTSQARPGGLAPIFCSPVTPVLGSARMRPFQTPGSTLAARSCGVQDLVGNVAVYVSRKARARPLGDCGGISGHQECIKHQQTINAYSDV